MAATFTVEDGTGLADANSYLSIADADQYNDDHDADATWDGLADADKQKHLRLATRYIDAFYGRMWRGGRLEAEQRLDWPRSSAWDDDGFAIDDDAVPSQVEDATAILAIKSAGGETFLDDETEGMIVKESDKVGPIASEVEYMGGKDEAKRFPIVERTLASVIHSSDQVVRG